MTNCAFTPPAQERQSGRKSFIFNVSRRRAPARAAWRVLDDESVEES